MACLRDYSMVMIRKLVLALSVLALAGCQSISFGPYVSPRVVGRVVAEDTNRPLAYAKVTRGKPEPAPRAGWDPKGAELLMRKGDVLTDHDGRFALGSERVLSLVRWGGWDSVPLSVERGGYQRFQTNYSITNLVATDSAAQEPTIDAGTIRLKSGGKGAVGK